MRLLFSLLVLLAVSGCASRSPAVVATMPMEIWRAEGEAPRMRPPRLEAGSTRQGAPFHLMVIFDGQQASLGKAEFIGWQMSLDGYCRDEFSVVRSVLIGSSGRIWRVNSVFVRAGPDRQQNWSSGGFDRGDEGADVQALFDAMDAGGRFTLAIEDDKGRLWMPQVVDTLTPTQRARLLATNHAAFEATDPQTVPVAGETPMIMVTREPYRLPSPPRPCPQSESR